MLFSMCKPVIGLRISYQNGFAKIKFTLEEKSVISIIWDFLRTYWERALSPKTPCDQNIPYQIFLTLMTTSQIILKIYLLLLLIVLLLISKICREMISMKFWRHMSNSVSKEKPSVKACRLIE